MHFFVQAPHATWTIFVPEEVLVQSSGTFQRLVELGVPASFPQTSPLVVRKLRSKVHMPAMPMGSDSRLGESTQHCWRHSAKVPLVNSPVEPCYLDAVVSAALNDFQGWLYSLQPFSVIAAIRVNEEVLHIHHYQDSPVNCQYMTCVLGQSHTMGDPLVRINGTTAVVADAIVGIDAQSSVGATREIEAFGDGIKDPLVAGPK